MLLLVTFVITNINTSIERGVANRRWERKGARETLQTGWQPFQKEEGLSKEKSEALTKSKWDFKIKESWTRKGKCLSVVVSCGSNASEGDICALTELTFRPLCILINSCSWQAVEVAFTASLWAPLPFSLGTIHCWWLSREEQRHLAS